MARSRAKPVALAFDALTVEGNLISPAMLTRVAARDAGGQAEADYGVPKGLTLRDEIARYFRMAQALFEDLHAAPEPSATATVAFVEALMRDVFGFADIARVGTRTLNDRLFAVTLEAGRSCVPVVVVPPADELDRATTNLPTDGRRRSAASAVQDWLNASDDALWGFCANGERLRLVRDNASLTRPAHVEADLRRMFEDDAFADFAAFWLLAHASRFGRPGAPATDCALERWREAGTKEGLVARERLRDGFEAALLALGGGFVSHPANSGLRARIEKGALPLPVFFGQLLRVVYRLIFLLAAEDRNLLHPPSAPAAARTLYAQGYSLSQLRDRSIRRASWDRHVDQWVGLRIAFTALARGEPRLSLPALGGLFAPGAIPDLEVADLPNRALMGAVYRLAWLREDGGIMPVNWRDMETEELGSVYEGLLELTPRLTDDGRGFAFAEGAETKGNERKKTGSYYTPDSLVQVLLDSALDPVLDRVTAEADDPAAALLTVTVIDPACGSGHFLLAAARRIATRLARARTGGVASAEDFRHALRDVMRACIHGVDRNPMAVELTKVALWIESVEPGKPLGFLDANIRCGDSLLGVYDLKALHEGIPDAAYKPLTGDDKETAAHFRKRNKAEIEGQGALDFTGGGGRLPDPPPLGYAARALRALPEDSAAEIEEKRRRFDAARHDSRAWAWKVACDLYVAAFLTPKTGGVPANYQTTTIPTTEPMWRVMAGGQAYGPLEACVLELAAEARVFHWPLEFPDVMAAGGFDVVLGNPPWEVMQLSEEEYFAQRLPEIAELAGATRKRAIAELETTRPDIFRAYEDDKRLSEVGNEYARTSGRFDLSARGKINTYALFAELFAGLAGPRGRAGVIVPTGIATDATTAPFFAALIDGRRLVRLISFENEEFVFPSVHHAFRFCLLVLSSPGQSDRPEFSFFLRGVGALGDIERRFVLTPADIARINPNTKTAPVFRSRADAELTARIYARVPVLIDETRGPASNPWGISFSQGLFNMTSDSSLFRTAAQLAEAGYVRQGTDWVAPPGLAPRQVALDLAGGWDTRGLDLQGGIARRPDCYVPLYEAKMIHQFDHRWATYDGTDSRDATPAEKADPDFEPTPRYWLPRDEVAARLAAKGWTRDWLMGWRDITGVEKIRTVISATIPKVAVGHTTPLYFVEQPTNLAACFFANWNSFALDYVARQKVGGTHLTYGYLTQFPMLPPAAYDEDALAFIIPRVLELTYTSRSMAPFARDLRYDGPPFTWDEDRRTLLRAELDAWYARAYGLDCDQLRYILDPADVRGADYPSETFRVLKNNEMKCYGEYRTARLVLEAWDRMERGEVRDTSPPIVVSTREEEAAPASIRIDPATLPDNAWARPRTDHGAETGLFLTALLKVMDGPMPIRQVRLAAVLGLEPRVMVPLVDEAKAALWRRLVGNEAEPLPKTVSQLPARNAAWGDAVRNLRGHGYMREDLDAGTWGSGDNLVKFETAGWGDGRAGFVLDVMRQIDIEDTVQHLPVELEAWVNAA